jgi:galactokinase/mevalonate kinase-like predicted kinase
MTMGSWQNMCVNKHNKATAYFSNKQRTKKIHNKLMLIYAQCLRKSTNVISIISNGVNQGLGRCNEKWEKRKSTRSKMLFFIPR